MATQHNLMPPGSQTNWPINSAFSRKNNRLSLESSNSSGVVHLLVPLEENLTLRTISKWQHLQPISQSNVIQINNFVDLNPWTKIRQEVLTWGELKADWDDEGAVIPRADGLKFLERMISRFKDEGSPKAMPYIAGDGEFGLHWRLPGGRAIVSILADGRVLAFCPRRLGDPVRIKSTVDQQIDMQAFYKALREIAQ